MARNLGQLRPGDKFSQQMASWSDGRLNLELDQIWRSELPERNQLWSVEPGWLEAPSKAANTLETYIATDCAGTRQPPNKGAKSQDCSKVKLQNKLKRLVTLHNIHKVKDPSFRILHNLHSIDDSDCIMHFYAWHISYPGLCVFMFLFVFHETHNDTCNQSM